VHPLCVQALYIANFALHTFLYLPYYAICKGRYSMAALSVVSMAAYFAAFSALHVMHPPMFWISLGFSSVFGPIMLMLGNFGALPNYTETVQTMTTCPHTTASVSVAHVVTLWAYPPCLAQSC